ncbi:LysR family transcriptional regulator [Rhodococcoides kyotonense]|uniref:DNA-binding transcriptional regulator, LysR family n=1 Tax=Rhodococcoides kyotonense TaxID=398843 RepID=A0A239L617_9NOCA|nr:LysR family transcriptional regulator [Rhodococcus kyotonensis]SNT24984.1 DNA-binding transcriptional regulator, LysR family [Rhodococcus kyotonensis]
MRDEAQALLPLIPTILAVADTEHITEASHVLGVPQPTVSRQMARASAILGVDIVERHGRGISLTTAGRILVPYLERAVVDLEAGLDAMSEHDARARGRISISFQNTLGEDIVPALIKKFRMDHPAVTFVLDQGARARCLDRLDDGSADVAFVALSTEHTEDNSFQLYEERLVLVVPADHRLARRRSVNLTDTADENYVAMGHGFGMRSICEDLWAEAGIAPDIAFEGQDIHTVRGLVGAGLGISILPRLRGHGPETVEVRIDDLSARRRIGMVWPARQLARQVQAFRTMVIRSGRSLVVR